MKAHNVHPMRPRTITGIMLLLLTVTGGSAWWTWQVTNSTTTAQPSDLTQVEPAQVHRTPVASRALAETSTAPSNAQERLQPESYWLQMNGQQVSLVPHPVTGNADSPSEPALTAGIIDLLTNAPSSNQSSAIPSGTRLLSLQTTPNGIYVNLSREFNQGGGSDSMVYRVAQVLYTITSLDPNAKVYLSVEGQLLDETHPLGGEGLILRQPLTRQQFNQDFSLN